MLTKLAINIDKTSCRFFFCFRQRFAQNGKQFGSLRKRHQLSLMVFDGALFVTLCEFN